MYNNHSFTLGLLSLLVSLPLVGYAAYPATPGTTPMHAAHH